MRIMYLFIGDLEFAIQSIRPVCGFFTGASFFGWHKVWIIRWIVAFGGNKFFECAPRAPAGQFTAIPLFVLIDSRINRNSSAAHFARFDNGVPMHHDNILGTVAFDKIAPYLNVFIRPVTEKDARILL